MPLLRRLCCLAVFTVVIMMSTACTLKFVAPYDSDLQQKASSMQAEVVAWDLTMRNGAGTISDDPRHPDVAAMINKWHGEAEAMLTIAISNDPGKTNCGEAVKGVYKAIESKVPDNLLPAVQSNVNATAPKGCEAGLVAQIDTDINDIEKVLKYCQVSWIPDAYFIGLGQNRATASTPPNVPDAKIQENLHKSCLAEFKVASQEPEGAAIAQHGRAVSALLTTLQSIVYVENRKKAAEASK